jgi:hypothetical protein
VALVSLVAWRDLSTPQLSADPLGGHKYILGIIMPIIKAVIPLMFFEVAFSQVPEMCTANIYSYDSSYVVTVKGDAYEGYCGTQQIILRNKHHRKLWQRKEDIWIRPVVSNLGDVAINIKGFVFFDKNNKKIGSFLPDEPNETYWSILGMAEVYPVYAYSYSGKNFYTILTDEKDNELVSVTRYGVQQWRILLPNDSVYSYNIYVYDGGALINCTHKWAGVRRRDSWILVNDTGEVIASYELSHSNLWLPIINNLKKELSIVESDSIRIFNLDSGLLMKTIPQETKLKHSKKGH